VLGFALLFALIGAAALARAWSLSFAPMLGAGLAILFAELPLLVLVSMLIARAASHPGSVRPGFCLTLRVWMSETAHFGRMLLAMTRNPAPLPWAGGSGRPIVLIHGILCNRGVWGALQARLHAAGFRAVLAVNLEPLLADIELQATRVQPEVLALHKLNHGARVAIVAHSMGGLVARVLLRNLGPEVVSRIITLATPHHGTRWLGGLPGRAPQQLARASPWLRALNALQEGRFAVPVVSLYSRDDNLVVPATSARLEGAEMLELRGLGHMGIARSKRALDQVIAALSVAGTA
jgi:triacylglycerol esterase/lipase EstA (alpha/beta hydrolase family)